jgi:hypothetical protein
VTAAPAIAPPPTDPPLEDGFVYVYSDLLEEIRFNASWRADRIAGGILIGRLFQHPDNQIKYVLLEGFVSGTHVEDLGEFVRYLSTQWKAAQAAQRYHFPEGQIVGWYAAFPKSGAEPDQQAQMVHHTFFGQPWQIGLWLDGPDDPKMLVANDSGFANFPVGVIPAVS